MEHTELPWKAEEYNLNNSSCFRDWNITCNESWLVGRIYGAGIIGADRVGRAKANAEFICHAVNNHDALVEALQEIHDVACSCVEGRLTVSDSWLIVISCIAQGALEKVKGSVTQCQKLPNEE